MTQQNPFSRARGMMAVIAAIMAFPGAQQITQLAALGEYKSRGHGGKHRPKGRFLGRFCKNTSKYQPHTGAKQIAKSARRAAGEPLVSMPRRMWVMNNKTDMAARNNFVAVWRNLWIWELRNSSRKPLAMSRLSRKYPIRLLPE